MGLACGLARRLTARIHRNRPVGIGGKVISKWILKVVLMWIGIIDSKQGLVLR
jgi:hypothetical protein